MQQANYKFTHIKGDTFEEVLFRLKINGVDVNLTGATIKMQLKQNPTTSTAALTLTSVGSAGITITSPTTGQFKINEQIINIEPYNYSYDLEIKFADNTVKTYISGTFNIIQDITVI